MMMARTMKIMPSVQLFCQSQMNALGIGPLTLEDEEIGLEFTRIEEGVAGNDQDACRHDERVPGCIWLKS